MTKDLNSDGAVEYVGIGPSMRFARGDAPARDVGRGGVECEVAVSDGCDGSGGRGVVMDLTGS